MTIPFIYGVIYLQPLMGVSGHPGMDSVVADAREQLQILAELGFAGALFENENDRPYSLKANAEAVSSMTYVLSKIMDDKKDLKIGIEFLINDPYASLTVAKAVGADFIRTDYFSDRMARAEYGGEIATDPDAIIAHRERIAATGVKIYTDIQVKYAQYLEERTLDQSAAFAREKGSDGIIVTGGKTGEAAKIADLIAAKQGCLDTPVLIGSGLAIENLEEFYPHMDGAFIGQGLMVNNRIDKTKAAAFMKKFKELSC